MNVANFDEIWNKACEKYGHDKSILIRILCFLLPEDKCLEGCLDLLDRYPKGVIKLQCSYPFKVLWKIPCSKGGFYYCLRNFCPCRSFSELNKMSLDLVLCKHLFVVRLASSIAWEETVSLGDDEYMNIVMNSYSSI